MKKFLVVMSAFMLLLGLSGAAGAYTIDYLTVPVGNEFTSPLAGQPGFVTENFNAAGGGPNFPTVTGLVWTWAGDGRVITGPIANEAAPPAGVGAVPDATKYIAIPIDLDTTTPNSVTATLGGSYNYFGIWWGSVDYLGANDINNVLKFYSGGTLVETITGAQAINPSTANGDQTAPGTNLYVNIHNLPFFDSFEMSSNKFAYEADNITVGVPEPGTLLLLGSGLLGLALAGSRRKFRK